VKTIYYRFDQVKDFLNCERSALSPIIVTHHVFRPGTFARRSRACSVRIFWKRFTTIKTSLDVSLTAAKICGSCPKVLLPRSLVRKDLSAERWAKPRSSSKASRTIRRSIHCTAQFTALAESWAAWKPPGRLIAGLALCSDPARSHEK
jgi:hypothetical protein